MKKIIQKIPGHTHHHSLLAIILATIAISAAVTIRSYVQASDLLTNTVTCSYKIKDWSKCDSTGQQTRKVDKAPADCTDADIIPPTTQSCTYAKETSCSYTYSDWGACSSSGYQTRTVTEKTPAKCLENTEQTLKRVCTYVEKTAPVTPVACSYTYSAWSVCDSSCYQARTVAAKSPSGCVDSATPILKQSCTYSTTTNSTTSIACAYNLSDWSACNSSEKQTRTIISKTPTGCYESDRPSLERQCEYSSAETIAASASSNTVATTSTKPPFNFLNLNGGEVIGGEITLQGTVSNASAVEFYLIPIESNSPKYLGLAKRNQQNVWEYKLDSRTQPNGSFALRAKIKNTYGTYDSEPRKLIILNPTQAEQNSPEANSDSKQPQKTSSDGRTNAEWQKKHFKEEACVDEKICGGEADPDRDGLNNNEEYRLGTNPTNSDTDQDGFLDGDEIKNGFNPLKAAPGDKSDKMVFENPKVSGEVKKELYKIENVEMISGENASRNLKLTGKALPNTYVTIYIYSDPVILTVKTDADGNWTYILDKDLEDGEHEVYVAVTDNTGKITGKSEPIAFVKTAEAATVITPVEASAGERAISPTQAWSKGSSYFFIAIALAGLALVLATIGLIKHELAKKPDITPLN